MTLRTMSLSLAALIMGAAPGLAQIAPEDVWAEIVEGMERGQLVLESANESREGDVLTITDIVVSQDDGFSVSTFTLPQIALRQTDGGVAIELPETSEIGFSNQNTFADEPTTGTLVMTLVGWSANLTGESIESYGYDYAADAITVALAEIDDPFTGVIEDPFVVTMSDLTGAYVTDAGEDGRDRIVQTATIASSDFEMAIETADPVSNIDLTVSFGPLDIESTSFVDPAIEPEDFHDALASGFAGDAVVTLGPSTYSLEVYEESAFGGPPTQFTLSGGSEGSEATFSLAADGMSYSASSESVRLAFETPELPIGEVSGTLERTVLALTAPTTSSEEAQDVAMELRLEGLTVSDNAWDMLPMMVGAPVDVPRDPATVALALSGQVVLPFDYFDTALYEQPQPPEPPLPTTLSLDEFRIDLAGVELAGTGSLDFDLDDLESFDGIPAPNGTIELSLIGFQGLIRTLVQAGLIPAEQAMFAQGMIGAIARPVGEDQFVSEIVFGPGASITANGFPLPLPQ